MVLIKIYYVLNYTKIDNSRETHQIPKHLYQTNFFHHRKNGKKKSV